MPRHVMRRGLDEPISDPLPVDVACRHPTPGDAEALAQLMLDAFIDPVDPDPGDTIGAARDEVARTFSGDYGELLPHASFVAFEGDLALSASIITRYGGAPFVAFSMTRADRKGRGMARAMLGRSIDALTRSGESRLDLEVTVGNDPAEHLYRSLGFRVVEVLPD